MNKILTFTDKAINQVKKIMNNAPTESNGIYVGIEKSGCSGYSYKIDFVKNDDIIKFELVYDKDIKIYIDPKATMYLLGSQMDYSTDKLSSRFHFNNPNEKNTCGCGESFSL